DHDFGGRSSSHGGLTGIWAAVATVMDPLKLGINRLYVKTEPDCNRASLQQGFFGPLEALRHVGTALGGKAGSLAEQPANLPAGFCCQLVHDHVGRVLIRSERSVNLLCFEDFFLGFQ